MEITACVFNMFRFNATDWLSLSSLAMLVLALVITLCHWNDLPKAADAQPLAAVAPKDAPAPAGPPPPPAQAAPAPVKPVPAPVQAAPVKPVVAAPVKPAPVKPAPPPAKPTDPTVVRIRPSGTKTTERPRLKAGQEPCDTTLTVRTDEAGHVVSMEVSTTANAAPAELKPYGGPGGGHHPVAKRALEGAPNYDANKALAIPNAELDRLGISHRKEITPAQRRAYKKFEETGKPLTWEAIAGVETDALTGAGMKSDMAKATVAKAIQALKDSGVTAPIRIPWGKVQ